MANDWSRLEVEALVADYLSMLELELRGENYNKTEHRRALSRVLSSRTDGSIERKHQNVSAILIELGYPYIAGYKPLSNYQALLADVVAEAIASSKEVVTVVQTAVQAPAVAPPTPDILSRWEPPPEAQMRDAYEGVRERAHVRKPTTNWLQIEAANSSLGRAGEEFVIRFERERLATAGKVGLADRV
jgi:hypothetical protein